MDEKRLLDQVDRMDSQLAHLFIDFAEYKTAMQQQYAYLLKKMDDHASIGHYEKKREPDGN